MYPKAEKRCFYFRTLRYTVIGRISPTINLCLSVVAGGRKAPPSRREQLLQSESGGLKCSMKSLQGLSDSRQGRTRETVTHSIIPKETIIPHSHRQHDAAQSPRNGSSGEQSSAALGGLGTCSSLGCQHCHPMGYTLLPGKMLHPLGAEAWAPW